jgi:hypothetical protein
VSEIDVIRERLEMDSHNEPIKLLGLTASFDLLNRIYTGLLTIMMAIAQRMLSMKSRSEQENTEF